MVWESGYVQPDRPNKASGAVRVLFWNTRYNGLHRAHDSKKKGDLTVLEQNMIGLVGSQWAPQIVVFSECKISMFSEQFQKQWMNRFAEFTWISYNSRAPDAGICIFSQFPLQQEVQTAALDWRPKNLSSVALKNYETVWSTIPNPKKRSERIGWGYRQMFERTFISSVFRTPHGPVQLLPVHLMNPWSKFSIEYPKAGIVWTTQALRYGSDAPIYNQLDNLLDLAGQTVRRNKVPTLLLGDFNLPSTWSYGYQRVLGRGWQETFPLAGRKSITFPVPSSKEVTSKLLGVAVSISMKIDQSFKSPGTDATSVVLPLSGSDHFPIWTVIVP